MSLGSWMKRGILGQAEVIDSMGGVVDWTTAEAISFVAFYFSAPILALPRVKLFILRLKQSSLQHPTKAFKQDAISALHPTQAYLNATFGILSLQMHFEH